MTNAEIRLAEILAKWAETIGGDTWYDYQRRTAKQIFIAILNEETEIIPIMWSRQSGKTKMMMDITICLSLVMPLFTKSANASNFPVLHKWENGFRTGVISGTLNQAHIPFQRIKTAIETQKKYQEWFPFFGAKLIVCNSEIIQWTNGSRIQARTAKPGSAKEGETDDFQYREEAQNIGAFERYKVFRPMLWSTRGLAVELGTPDYFKCEFYEITERAKRTGRLSLIDDDEACKYNPAYKASIDDYIKELPGGVNNDYYLMTCKCKWIFAGSQVLTWEQYLQMQGTHLRGSIDKQYKHLYFVGIDVAKIQDRTVCTLLEQWPDHYRVIDWLSFEPSECDHLIQDEVIAKWLVGLNLPLTVVEDSTGLGDVRVETLTREVNLLNGQGINIIGLNYTAKAKHILYQTFEKTLPNNNRKAKLLFPVCPENDKDSQLFAKELTDCQLENKAGLFNFHHPDNKMDSASGLPPHDDYVCSLFNALYAAECVYA